MSDAVTVYYDYLCPFAWRGAEVAEAVHKVLGLTFTWQHFSLYQSNYNGAGSWQLWNDPIDPDDESGGKGLLPFMASCAARKQGLDLHHRYRLAALRARHRDHEPLTLRTLLRVAEGAGLDMQRFENDLSDPECRTTIAHEHYRAKALEVFGTPTFRFPSGHTAYFRLRELPSSEEEAVALFQDYRGMLERYPYLETVKRPRAKGN